MKEKKKPREKRSIAGSATGGIGQNAMGFLVILLLLTVVYLLFEDRTTRTDYVELERLKVWFSMPPNCLELSLLPVVIF